VFIIPFTRQVDWKVVPLTFSVFLLFHFTTPSYKLDKVDDEEEEEYFFFRRSPFLFLYCYCFVTEAFEASRPY